MRKILLLTILTISQLTTAQTPVEKGLNSINDRTAQAHVEFLASDNLLGREAGTRESVIAAEYIVSNLKIMAIKPLLGNTYYQPFTARNRKFVKDTDTLFYRQDRDTEIIRALPEEVSLRNVLAYIPGKKTNEYVIVGAHLDHIGIDPHLDGDQIFNGADDNASGVSAVLQIARAFIENGKQPERTVIFAFWDGEEKGLLGSRYFVENFADINQVKCYLNFDMIGRNSDENNPNTVVYFYTDTHPQFGEWLKQSIQKYKFALQPAYQAWDKPTSGSDNASFARKDIPIIWYHTNGHPDFHQPGDHADKINYSKLVEITKTAYLVLWKAANTN